ncbi:MerR family transcriptional regulator [Vagococcus elongatus]|nr:MerR family transcriptional regulator [Vagococcus elongatus]
MSEVKEKTKLTRKAIEYYEEKGLIKPKREENNYRVYSQEDVEKLSEIYIYRKLGCSLDQIKELFKRESNSSLAEIIRGREIESQLENVRVEALKQLLNDANIDEVKEQLDFIDRQETIYSKLMRVFPGYLGQLYFMSYKNFLDEKLEEDKVKYYEEYIELLDSMPDLPLTDEEKNLLEQSSKDISKLDMEKTNEEKMKAIENTDEWLKKNEELISQYMSFKTSDLYMNNPIIKIQEKLREYMEKTGYYEVGIPLIRKFSSSYDDYYKKLLKANDKFIDKKK